MKVHTPSLLVAALASLALVGCGKGGSASGASGDLAVVNGEAITMDEYYRYLERKPAVQVLVSDAQLQPGQVAEMQSAAPLGFQALRDLINRRILLDVARDEKVMPTDADVAKELEFQTKQRPQFIKSLTDQGLTLEDVRRDLTLDLAKEHIVTKGITVTTAEAEKYIKENPERFMTPEQAKLCIIQVRDAAGRKQVDTELASGKAFPQVAVQYSTAANVRQNNGYVVINDVGRAQPALQQIIHETTQGKATDWKPDGPQFIKILVEQKVAAKARTIDDTVKEVVRRSMALDRGNSGTDLPRRLVDKLKSSKIVVNPTSLKTLWEKAFKSLQEQDVTANTRTGATGGGATPNGAPPAGATPAGAPAPATP